MEVVLCYSLELIDVGFVKVGSFEALSQGILEMSVGEGIQDGRLLSDKGKMDGVFGFVGANDEGEHFICCDTTWL